MSVLTELPKYWLDGVVRGLHGFRRGIGEAYPAGEDPPPTTPYEVVYEGGKTRLRYYPAIGRPLATPILICYSLVKRPFILDLLPGRSVVETLTKSGLEVYFIDWVPPTQADSWRGFDAYVNGDLANAVRAIQIREGVDRVSLLGYCFGGLLTTMYAALYPDQIRNLVNFTLPFDMSVRELPTQALMEKISPQTMKLMTEVYGNCPAWFMKASFDAMAPVHHALDKYVGLYRGRENKDYVQMFDLFEKWMNSDVPMAGQIFRETIEELSRKNALVKNEFQIRGQAVDLQNITCPVLNVIGQHDDVVHPKSSLPLVELVGGEDATNLVFPTGHIGAAVSTSAQKKLWPQVGRWLRERDSLLGH